MDVKLRYRYVDKERIELFTVNRSVASASLLPIGSYDNLFFNPLNLPIYFFHRINVIEGYRGIGEGTLLLTELCKIADEEKIAIFLGINPSGRMNRRELKEWYEKYGWEYLHSNMMIRWPKGVENERK